METQIQKCQHQWKIIREEEGTYHFMFTSKSMLFYHLQCKKCGDLRIRELPVACRKCNHIINKTQ
jgi:hypothetical protein